ncbi:MAG: hypothetical protein RL154_183, partial [Pseudomonadota bacterium]
MNMAFTYEELLLGCESEKLHLSGHIQSFGALIIVDSKTSKITHASVNLIDYCNIEAKTVLGQFGDELNFDLSKLIYKKPDKVGFTKIVQNFSINKLIVDVIVNFDGNNFILEFQKCNDSKESNSASLFHQAQLDMLMPPETSNELKKYEKNFTQYIQDIIDFDRVMIYKFHDDWSGEVICESAKENIGCYLGLRYPASDIPAIARNIYLLNHFRLIPDIKKTPCK